MSQAKMLLMSQDAGLVAAIRGLILRIEHLDLDVVESLEAALGRMDDEAIAMLILDVDESHSMPAAQQILKDCLQRTLPHVAVYADARPQIGIALMQVGFAHCFPRPLDLNRLAFYINNFTMSKRFELARKVQERAAKRPTVQSLGARDPFLFHSGEMGDLMAQVQRVAPQQVTILIGGETGTGKTRLASLVHELSDRRGEPFMVVNCGALSANVIESELFGHVRGAFTGADRDRHGKFHDVGKGTLFLDDIDTLPASVQIKLLRAIEDRKFEPLGSNKCLPLQARLIAASNVSLDDEVKAGRFRSDLLYRLQVLQLSLPPLRERKEMIEELARKFIKEFASVNQRPVQGISGETVDLLKRYAWKGNIRELRNVIERAVALCAGTVITPEDLPQSIRCFEEKPVLANAVKSDSSVMRASSVSDSRMSHDSRPPDPKREDSKMSLAEMKDEAEYEAIVVALQRTNNNKSLAALELGISRPTLYKKLRRYGLLGGDEDSENSSSST